MNRALRYIALVSIAAAFSARASGPQAGPPSRAELPEADCHPSPDPGRPQYIVGYGSLMQDDSRKRTSPQAGPAYPIDVAGFRRGWFARPESVGFGTTYLGVAPDPSGSINAVIYLVEANELAATDRREVSYCRKSVPIPDIRSLERAPFDAHGGQVWIYVNKPQAVAAPNATYPIVQSYVDIFLSGCLEQEQRFELKDFAQRCIATTHDWSEYWVNDRIFPRRPFVYQPKAPQIDSLLSKYLPQYFSRIRIEEPPERVVRALSP